MSTKPAKPADGTSGNGASRANADLRRRNSISVGRDRAASAIAAGFRRGKEEGEDVMSAAAVPPVVAKRLGKVRRFRMLEVDRW